MISAPVWGSISLEKVNDRVIVLLEHKQKIVQLPNDTGGIFWNGKCHFDRHLTLFVKNGHRSLFQWKKSQWNSATTFVSLFEPVEFIFGTRLIYACRAEISDTLENDTVRQIGTIGFWSYLLVFLVRRLDHCFFIGRLNWFIFTSSLNIRVICRTENQTNLFQYLSHTFF